jgi:hypothetical protein
VTETEAQQLLDEHRTSPRFVVGTRAYHVAGLCVEIYRRTPSGRRIYECTVSRTSYAIPPDVRRRLEAL